MGGLCTCCRPQVPKDQNSTIKKHGSILRRKTSISAAFSFESTPLKIENDMVFTSRKLSTSGIPNTLDINTATEEDLMTLPMIGRAIAHNIVEYRKQIGSFRLVEDLVLVNGVGATKLERLRKEIHVSSQSTKVKNLSSADGSLTNLLVNLNSANYEQLCSVDGISDELALKIIAYRAENGNFSHINDLVEPAALIDTPKLLQIKTFLTVDKNGRRHSRNSSLTSFKVRNSSAANFIGFGPECLESSRTRMEPVTCERFGRPIVRIATWNLQQFSAEKVKNPGVREVVCATILENGIKIIAVQELADKEALEQIVSELNSPSLPNIQRLKGNSKLWECVVSPSPTGRMYQGSEYNGFLWDSSADVQLYSSALLEKPSEGKDFTRLPFLGYFKVGDFDAVLACLHLKAISHLASDKDRAKLNDEIVNLPLLVDALLTQVPEEKDIIIMGDFNLEPGEKEFSVLRKKGFTSLIPDTTPTNISTKNMKGSRCYDNIWLSKNATKLFTTQHQVVRNGLTNPWIPDGWSWGGVVSDHCPVWAEFFTDQDLDSEPENKSMEGLRLS